MHIISCDPGHSSGLIWMTDFHGERQLHKTAVVLFDEAYREIAALIKHVRKLSMSHPVHQHVVVVVEDFIGGGRRTAYAHEALKVHGFTAGLGTISGLEVRVQVPQARQAFIADAWTLWRAWAATQDPHPKSSMHVIDALAHALVACYQQQRQRQHSAEIPPVLAATPITPKEVSSNAR